ncbi:hypothetical protein B0H14DRAFT_2665871 [Mycena olivaceomarginata]|nr:hypothetical protein B0H14DRAFT_2665871 [Mycena olivaceomarginata]
MTLLRFAPSPTGSLHLGGLRMALYNHLYAKKNGGKWILRVEDTDSTRLVPGAVDGIRHALEWAGLEYDYGPGKGGPHAPYFQSERLDLYRSYTTKLLNSGHAYRCFCSLDTLSEIREKFARMGSGQSYDMRCLHLTEEESARRLRAGEKHIVRLNSSAPMPRRPTADLVFGHLKDAHGSLATDPVLLKSDGYPTYHLANVVDDHTMGITHVLRGEFAHIPILLNPDGTKMSKRNGDVKVEDYIRGGWERGAILNWLALAGWGTQYEAETPPESGSGLPSAESPAPTKNEHQSTTKEAPESTTGQSPTLTSNKHLRTTKEAPESTKVMNMDELISEFEISAITHRSSSLDPGKLTFLNRQHLLRSAATTNRTESLNQISDELTTPEYIESVIRVLDSRLINIHGMVSLAPYLFFEPDYNSDEASRMLVGITADERSEIAESVYSALGTGSEDGEWSTSNLHEVLTTTRKRLATPRFLPVLRHALTGMKAGPPVADIMAVLGRDRTVARIRSAQQLSVPK